MPKRKKVPSFLKGRPVSAHSFNAVCYLTPALRAPRFLLKRARYNLRNVKFQTIVVRGTSGVLFGGMLALTMRKKLAIVRKEEDGAHSSNPVEGWRGGRYLFVDDLISSGQTYRDTRNKFAQACRAAGRPFEFVGAYLYRSGPDRLGEYRNLSECRKLCGD